MPMDLHATALLGSLVGTNTVGKLVEKGVLTNDEGLEIYTKSLSAITNPKELADAKAALKILVPGLEIS